MKKIILIITFFLLFSCHQEKQTIKGDLCFKLVNFFPVNGFAKEKAGEIEKMLDSLNSNSSKDTTQKGMIQSLKRVRKHQLLTASHITLRLNGNDVKMIFLSQDEYRKLEKYTLDYLSKNNKKVELELNVKTLEEDLLYSDEIVKMNESEGKTYFIK